MTVHYEFDVVVGENQVLIKLSENAIPVLRDSIGRLVAYLDHAQPKRKLRERLRFDREQRALLWRLFPPVSDYGPMNQEFEERWGGVLHAELFGAAQRVLASIGDDGTARYQLSAIDDWIRVLGQTRLLWVQRSETGDMMSEDDRVRSAGLFTWMQTQLVYALRPELAAQLTG
ncbi:hypothetical protein [Kutzneria kofuensis]|uniref:DUF2017 domain-containing protein n=1 Tax=Kutzneria kofuensis TaxID=103725 RepID=A0A7W9NGL2_9PSEU|nr:hypothetical protein [Kutzneria kofuensis]MBB5891188.1 hypothetical protein [Kutzneria kofuensis]